MVLITVANFNKDRFEGIKRANYFSKTPVLFSGDAVCPAEIRA